MTKPESNDLLSPEMMSDHWQAYQEIWGAGVETQQIIRAAVDGTITSADLTRFHDSIENRLILARKLIGR